MAANASDFAMVGIARQAMPVLPLGGSFRQKLPTLLNQANERSDAE